jgi:hypothetical protein
VAKIGIAGRPKNRIAYLSAGLPLQAVESAPHGTKKAIGFREQLRCLKRFPPLRRVNVVPFTRISYTPKTGFLETWKSETYGPRYLIHPQADELAQVSAVGF